MSNAHIYLSAWTSSDTDNPKARIAGESEDEYHEGDIVIDSWNWNLARLKQPLEQGGAGASIMKFSKGLDASTPPLLNRLRTRAPLEMCEFNLVEHSEDARFGLTVTLFQVQVVDYALSVSGGDDGSPKFTENWEFEYNDIRFDYLPELARNQNLGKKREGTVSGTGASVVEIYRISDDAQKAAGKRADEEAILGGDTVGGDAAAAPAAAEGGSAGGGGASQTLRSLDELWYRSRDGFSGEGIASPRTRK
ncbi:MAG: type VI secretion system tube protein Hcp [Pseudomonadota bacterium]|nr:type VI secretion system tube protein Hcp [Pseudomonadota bacterium]